MASLSSASGRAKVARHRATLRAAGLRPLQIWIPDTSAPGFAQEAQRQARLVDRDGFADIMEWLEDVSEFDADTDAAR